MYQTEKKGFITTSDLNGRISGTEIVEDRIPDQIYVLYPIIKSETRDFDRHESAFVVNGIPYVGELRRDETIVSAFDRISIRDAMRDARKRAGWG